MTNATTAPALSIVTAETALAAYQVACATNVPRAFETAAHALASALRAERARRLAPRPPHGSRPRLAVVNPEAQSAPAAAPAKPKGKSAPRALDLDAPVNVPRRSAAVGVFHALWADGTVTRVSCVSWSAAKPQTRWARAYQAANRLRRNRQGRELERDLSTTAMISGRWARGAGGMRVTSPDWIAYLAAAPMAPLAAIYCETTGETFDAPEGSAFGAGDRETALALESRMCTPRLPWAEPEARRCGGAWVETDAQVGTLYLINRPGMIRPGTAHVSPWCEPHRRLRRSECLAAFEEAEALARPIEPRREPVLGGPCDGRDLAQLAGAQVAVDRELAKALALAAEAAADRGRDKAESARARMLRRVAELAGHVWTIRADVGGRTLTLLRPGFGATLPLAALACLRLAEGWRVLDEAA